MRSLATLLLAFFVLVSTPSSSVLGQVQTGGAARTFIIQAKLFDDGRVVGAPDLVALEGQPLIVTLASDRGYSMRLIAREEPVSAEYGRRVLVKSEIFLRHAGRWAQVSAPNLTVLIGKSVSYELQASGRRDKVTGYPFRVEMTVSDGAQESAQNSKFIGNACSERKEAVWRETMANRASVVLAQGSDLPC